MKVLFLLLALNQLTVAVDIAPVVLGGNSIAKSCPSEEKLERASYSKYKEL